MFQAIAAVLGLATSTDKTATAQYLTGRAETEAAIEYTRQKNLSFYTAYKNQMTGIAIIAGVGCLFLIGIIYLNKKK
jgi:hypothetical protein